MEQSSSGKGRVVCSVLLRTAVRYVFSQCDASSLWLAPSWWRIWCLATCGQSKHTNGQKICAICNSFFCTLIPHFLHLFSTFFFPLFHLQSYIYIQWAGNSDYFLHNLYYAKLIANFVCRWWMRTPLDGRWKIVPPPLFAEECGIIDLCEVGGRGTFFSHDREMALPRIQPTNHTHALS